VALPIDESVIRRGLAAARWPGRMELLEGTPVGRVLLDGAHNPAGARALAAALHDLGMRRFPLVLGAMRGKRVSAVLRALAPLEPSVVFTAVEDAGAHRPATLLRAWQRIGGAGGESTATAQLALGRAAELRTAPDQPIVVAGSLYLVGAVRGMLAGEEEAA
jgi:dihydrofolate synthase/folylpolyglutamate synthase